MDRNPAGNYYSLDFWHVLMYICCIMHGLLEGNIQTERTYVVFSISFNTCKYRAQFTQPYALKCRGNLDAVVNWKFLAECCHYWSVSSVGNLKAVLETSFLI